MSIILDALRKAQQDRTRGLHKEGGTGSIVIPTDKGKTPTLTSILIVVCCILVFSAAVYYFLLRPKNGGPQINLRPIAALPALPSSWAPKDREALLAEALRLYQEGNYKESALNWEKLSKVEPQDAEVANNLGLALKKSNDREGALKAYEKALQIDPNFPYALNNRAVLYMEEALWDKAEALLVRASEVQPDYAEPHLQLALIMEKKGMAEKAISHFKNFLDLNPAPPDKLKRQIELRMAILQASIR